MVIILHNLNAFDGSSTQIIFKQRPRQLHALPEVREWKTLRVLYRTV